MPQAALVHLLVWVGNSHLECQDPRLSVRHAALDRLKLITLKEIVVQTRHMFCLPRDRKFKDFLPLALFRIEDLQLVPITKRWRKA